LRLGDRFGYGFLQIPHWRCITVNPLWEAIPLFFAPLPSPTLSLLTEQSQIIGVLCALNWGRTGFGAGFFKAPGISVGTVLALAGLAALLCSWQADLPPTIDGNRLLLAIELRFPAGDSFLKLLALEDQDIRRSGRARSSLMQPSN
jgi:hypothetical protein